MKKKKEKEIILYKTVRGSGYGTIGLPRFLIGKEVKISFMGQLTEKEEKRIELNKLQGELREIREKRRKNK